MPGLTVNPIESVYERNKSVLRRGEKIVHAVTNLKIHILKKGQDKSKDMSRGELLIVKNMETEKIKFYLYVNRLNFIIINFDIPGPKSPAVAGKRCLICINKDDDTYEIEFNTNGDMMAFCKEYEKYGKIGY